MKFFAFLMAFLVMALSVMPCADGGAFGKEPVKIAKTHQDNSPQEDDCSPFCQCACCAGFSIQPAIVTISPVAFYNSVEHGGFYNPATIDIALPIWQPPQLV